MVEDFGKLKFFRMLLYFLLNALRKYVRILALLKLFVLNVILMIRIRLFVFVLILVCFFMLLILLKKLVLPVFSIS